MQALFLEAADGHSSWSSSTNGSCSQAIALRASVTTIRGAGEPGREAASTLRQSLPDYMALLDTGRALLKTFVQIG